MRSDLFRKLGVMASHRGVTDPIKVILRHNGEDEEVQEASVSGSLSESYTFLTMKTLRQQNVQAHKRQRGFSPPLKVQRDRSRVVMEPSVDEVTERAEREEVIYEDQNMVLSS
jgi:hypothetical protein